MTQALFWTLVFHPGPTNTYYTEPSKQRGFLTEKDAQDYYDAQYSRAGLWIDPQIIQEPLADAFASDQFYVVVDANGKLETGSYSSVSPKLYRLKDAKAVAKKNDKQWYRKGTAPSRVVPVTLSFGAPIT